MENNIQRSALIVVDMQKVFINDQTKKVLERIKTFLTRKDRLFSCVIGTQYVNNKNTACYQYEGWKECMEGVKKDKYTCYTEEFLKILKDNHINKVFFCGVNTGCCVLHSVLDCYENIIDCYVIEDLCGSTSGEHYHDISIDLLGTLITKERIVTSKGLD